MWTSVKDGLPVIPKDRYGVSVIVAMYDRQYADACKNPKAGWEVYYATYGDTDGIKMYEGTDIKFDFIQVWSDGEWGPTSDPVYFWQYLPDAPDMIPGD